MTHLSSLVRKGVASGQMQCELLSWSIRPSGHFMHSLIMVFQKKGALQLTQRLLLLRKGLLMGHAQCPKVLL